MQLRKIYIAIFACLVLANCSQNTIRYPVNLATIEPQSKTRALPSVLDLRPETEKERIDFGYGIGQISDKRFSVDKMTYLQSKLAHNTDIKSAKVIKFQHIIDLSHSVAVGQAIAIESALAATQGGYWHSPRPKGQNSVYCELQMVINNTTYSGYAEAFFPHKVYWFSPYERDDIKQLLVQITDEAIEQIVSETKQ